MEPWIDDHARLTLVTEIAGPRLIKINGEVLNKDNLPM